MKEFANILKQLRKSKDLSQEELGKLVHVSRSAIAKYENGLGLPSEDVVTSLCNFFEIEKDQLMPKEKIEEVIVDKNKKIKKQKIAIIISSCLIVLLIAINILISFIKVDDLNGKLEIVSGEKISEIADDKVNYFTINKYQFGYINVYKNKKNEIILSPGGQLWSLNGLPDYLMGYYNGESTDLYLYINGIEVIEINYDVVNNQGKYCYNTSKYKTDRYNFVVYNNSLNDINIRQLEFWC